MPDLPILSADYVAFHATRTPERIAVRSRVASITYRELAAQVDAAALRLREARATAGKVAVLACADGVLQLTAILACQSLRVVAAPVTAPYGSQYEPAFRSADLVVSDTPLEVAGVKAHVVLAPLPRSALLRAAAAPDVPVAPVVAPAGSARRAPAAVAADTPAFILTTSGTTGALKRVVLTARVLAGRIGERVWHYGLSAQSQFLVAMPLSVGVVATSALATLQLGATVVFDDEVLVRERLGHVTHTVLLPVHLVRILAALDEHHKRPAQLSVVSIGSPLAPALREEALARIATQILDGYGSNEAGPVSLVASDGRGVLFPGVEARIVDDAEQDLGAGMRGHIALRAPWMCDGYLGDPAATARAFRGGWFLPGDEGVMHTDGRLEVLGRSDDLLNIGGLKLAPERYEEALAVRLGAPCALVSLAGARGVEELYVVIAGYHGPHEGLAALVAGVLGPDLGPVRVLQTQELPRTAAGKLQRSELRRAVAASVAQLRPGALAGAPR